MEADTGFRAHGPFQQMLVLVRMNSTGNQYKHFTETRAKEIYKCIKLIPPYERNKQRDLHEFNQQHEQSVLHLTNSTGETMPSKDALCRLDDGKNPIHTYTETVVNGQSVFDELQVKGKRVLLEENYYNAAQHAYDALADNDNTFLDRSAKSKIQKIQTFLIQGKGLLPIFFRFSSIGQSQVIKDVYNLVVHTKLVGH